MSLLSWLTRRRFNLDEDEFHDEIRAHLAIAERERIADGADREAAHYAALKEFGNVTLTTEAARRVWTPPWLDVLRDQAGDIRYAVRALAGHPVFSLTLIGVLTLGIGLNAAVFTMLKGIAFNPLAGVAGSSRLVTIYGETTSGRRIGVSYPDFQYLRDHDRAFDGLMGSAVAAVGLGRGRGSRSLWSELVTGNYFQVLGVRAERGRTLLPSDEVAPGRHPVVVISDGMWRREFAADPDIVGRTVVINNRPLAIVGVADPAFHGTTVVYDVEVYIPIMMAPDLGFTFGSQATTASGILSDRSTDLFFPQGFLRPGSTLASAAAEADALWAALASDRPLDQPGTRLRVVPFWQTPDGAPEHMLPALIVMSVMGLFVLSIACANIAGLVLVRGMSRRGEIAVRLALGATRARIVRLLIVENLVLALPGAVLGVLLASYMIPVLVGYADALAAPRRLFFNVEVDALVIGFAVLVACGSALLSGFLPALRSSRVDLVSVINEDASPRGAARGRLRAGLVVAQVAVSLLLLVGAGLTTRSVEAARRVYPGFDGHQVTAIALDLKQNGYDESRGRVFYRHLLEAVEADPGTTSAALAAFEPLNLLETPARRVSIEGYAPRRGEDVAFLWNAVGPEYFRTLRIDVLAGRAFNGHDDETGAPVAIVNRTLAGRFWGGAGQAIGRRVRVGAGEWRNVVGVVGDVKYLQVNESPRPYVYLPFLQSYRSSMILHTRGEAPVDVLLDQARAHIETLDANLPILFQRSLAEHVNGSLIFLRLVAAMLSVFGIAGMALAAMGTYGLVSYTVRQSTHEIGIRVALGASDLAIVRRFLGRGLWLGTLGAGLGVVAAVGVGTLLQSVLIGVGGTDAISFLRAIAIVGAVVVAATIVPAWRAARTDPLQALRHQ